MKWNVITPFSENEDSPWLHDFVPGNRHVFKLVPKPGNIEDWHKRKSNVSGLNDWKVYWKHAGLGLRNKPDGLITVFPQLALTAGIQSRLMGKRIPIIAYLFNVGTPYPGLKKHISRFGLKHISRFVVHTTREIDIYSEWLNLPRDRFQFLPIQRGDMNVSAEEDRDDPFIVSMGSAYRDYRTLIDVVRENGIKTIIIAAPRAVEGLDIPDNVEVVSGISLQECQELSKKARLNIIPSTNTEEVTASGQITIVSTLMLGKALIISDCNGASDYVTHKKTGWLVESGSAEELKQAIETLWNDDALRDTIAQTAEEYSKNHYTDEAAGKALGALLDEIEDMS